MNFEYLLFKYRHKILKKKIKKSLKIFPRYGRMGSIEIAIDQ